MWDVPRVSTTASTSCPDAVSRAQLLAAFVKESGAWFHALPITSLGLCMDDITVWAVVSLCLGTPLCSSHNCHHCGAEVSNLGTHGLSCHWSEVAPPSPL